MNKLIHKVFVSFKTINPLAGVFGTALPPKQQHPGKVKNNFLSFTRSPFQPTTISTQDTKSKVRPTTEGGRAVNLGSSEIPFLRDATPQRRNFPREFHAARKVVDPLETA